MEKKMYVCQEDLYTLEAQWRELSASDENCTIFQSWEWMSEWLNNFGTSCEARILCAHESGSSEIRGILPLMRLHKSLEWRFLGDTPEICPDHLDIISSQENKMAVCVSFLEYISSTSDMRICNFDHVSDRSPLRNTALNGSQFWKQASMSCKYQVLPLSGGWLEIEKGLSKNFRKSISYQERRLRKEYDIELDLASPENAIDIFRRMVELHTSRWNQLSQGGAFQDANVCRLHEEIINKLSSNRECILAYLKVKDDIVSVMYGFAYKNVFYFYNSGFDSEYSKYSPSVITLAFTIKAAIELGCTSFDFLRGNEGYKDKWPGNHFYDWNVRLYKKSFSGIILITIYRMEKTLGNLLEACKNLARQGRSFFNEKEFMRKKSHYDKT